MAESGSVFADIFGRDSGTERSFVLGDQPRSYGDLLSVADRLANRLTAAGCARGSRVGICLDQGQEYVASLLGVWKAGGVSVLLAPGWTSHEKLRVMRHAESRLILVDTSRPLEIEPLRSEIFDGLECTLQEYDQPENEPAQTEDAVLIYTSGTTGEPKGVMLTEQGISANVKAVAEYLQLSSDDCVPVFTPSCYAYSLSQNLAQAWAGGAILPVPSGLMFPMDILEGTSRHRLTGISATPTAFRILCDLDVGLDLDLGSVRFAMCGGQFLDVRLVRLIESLLPNTKVVNMYGCTENSPRISYHYVDGKAGMDEHGYFAVGWPVRGTRIRIRGTEKQSEPGTAGEVLITGTSLMRGYWKDPAATAERLQDGWFHTRDLGYLDQDNFLHLTGRQSNIINIGNEKVSPEEVEKVLLDFPGVRDATVYGSPDPLFGETVEAQVVIAAGSRILLTDLQRHCRQKISSYKIPRRILIVDSIPRTLYGKVDRRGLARKTHDYA